MLMATTSATMMVKMIDKTFITYILQNIFSIILYWKPIWANWQMIYNSVRYTDIRCDRIIILYRLRGDSRMDRIAFFFMSQITRPFYFRLLIPSRREYLFGLHIINEKCVSGEYSWMCFTLVWVKLMVSIEKLLNDEHTLWYRVFIFRFFFLVFLTIL